MDADIPEMGVTFASRNTVGAVLLSLAIDADGPWVAVCRADRKADAPQGVELTASPLLLTIPEPSLH